MRVRFAAAGLAGFVVLAGCGVDHTAVRAPVRSHEVLFVGSGRSLTAVDAGTGTTRWSTNDGWVASADWSRLVRAVATNGAATNLQSLDPSTGAVITSQQIPGYLLVRAVSHDGSQAALVPSDEAVSSATGAYRPTAHATTTIAVVSPDDGRIRQYHLAGNLAPEAFSFDGSVAFVIQYTPAMNPTKYQVRQLDLATGVVSDAVTTDKELQTAMGGVAHTQVLAPDGGRLYTLYTKPAAEGAVPAADVRPAESVAFIHVLDLQGKWAQCVDLPLPFGASDAASSSALATSPDGSRLYVSDLSAGVVAEIDTVHLKVVRTVRLAQRSSTTWWQSVPVAAGPNRLYLGIGPKVIELDANLDPVGSMSFAGTVGAVQVDRDGRRLWVGLSDEVELIDPTDARVALTVGVSGADAISHEGVAPPPLAPGRGGLQCAC